MMNIRPRKKARPPTIISVRLWEHIVWVYGNSPLAPTMMTIIIVLLCPPEFCATPFEVKLEALVIPLETAIAELDDTVSGAAVTVSIVVGSVGLSCAIDFVAEAFVAVSDPAAEDDEVILAGFVEDATAVAEDAGDAEVAFVGAAADCEALDVGVLDDTEVELAPAPTATIGPDVAKGLRSADNGPKPTPRSVPVGFTPRESRGDEAVPNPALVKGSELSTMVTERGPIPTPRRRSAEDDVPKSPSAALPIPPNRPEGAVCNTLVEFWIFL